MMSLQSEKEAKYIKALKTELLKKINKKAVSCIKLKIYNEVLVVDISVRAPRKNPYYVLSYTYHDVYAMPLDLTYGIAQAQASIIYDSLMKNISGLSE